MKYLSLFLFCFMYFVMNGCSAFLPKYYAELGISESGIGLLTSIPGVIATCFVPMWGVLTDRIREKRYVVILTCALAAGTCLLLHLFSAPVPLLLSACLYSAITAGTTPASTAISLEYCAESGRPYGPVRLIGTVGYQAGAVLVGAIFVSRLRGIYLAMGGTLLLSCAAAIFMPRVTGRQYASEKVPLTVLFRDRYVTALLGMILFATVSSQFYMSFFTKYLGDIGLDNGTVSLITLLSVLPEIPFLWFCDKIKNKLSIWRWIWIGIAVNGVRWLCLAFMRGTGAIIAVQLICAVTVMACFETMPAFWIEKRVPEELRGSALSVLNVTTFGVGRVIGGLIGGIVCEKTGIPFMFGFFGCALTLGSIALFIPVRRLEKADTTKM